VLPAAPVDWSARCETPAGDSGRLETPQAKPRRLKHRPAESERLKRKSTGSQREHTIFWGINNFNKMLLFLRILMV